MNTAIINSDSYEKHDTGNGHPEQPKRVIAIKEKLCSTPSAILTLTSQGISLSHVPEAWLALIAMCSRHQWLTITSFIFQICTIYSTVITT